MSSSLSSLNSFLDSPFINMITGYISQIQERQFFTRERINIYKRHVLITVGFFVLLYFLIHLQFVLFWTLKLLFYTIFQIISTVFWLPLTTARLLIPRTIDYDILFPLFWLCSVASFYISKFYHETICQFYDQYLVPRYKILEFDRAKREDIKQYLFISTFIVLLLFQSLFILVPIASSIKRHNAITKVSLTTPVDTQTAATILKSTTTKSSAEEIDETINESLYNRFINAFKDENEGRSRLVNDQKHEHLLKTMKNEILHSKSTIKHGEINQPAKSSRFQRWIVHYLKAPFKKWEGKAASEKTYAKIQSENDEEEEHDTELDSSSSSIFDDEVTDDEDDENDNDDDDYDSEYDDHDHNEYSTITENIDKMKNLGQELKENVKSKVSSSNDDDEEGNDVDDEKDSSLFEKFLTKPIEVSSSIFDNGEESGYESDDEEEDEEPSPKLTDKIKQTFAQPIETVKSAIAGVKNKIVHSHEKEDEPSILITEHVKEHLTKPIETIKEFADKVKSHAKDKFSSLKNTHERDSGIESAEEEHEWRLSNENGNFPPFTEHNEIEQTGKSSINDRKEKAANVVKSIKDKISTNIDTLGKKPTHMIDSAKNFASDANEKISDLVKDKLGHSPKSGKFASKIKDQVVKPLDNKYSHVKHVISNKVEHLKEKVDSGIKSLKKKVKKTPKTLAEKALRSTNKILKDKFSRHRNQKKTISSIKKLKSRSKFYRKLNGLFDDPWNIWHLAKRKLAQIFISPTKHARHIPRYNTTSLYTAFTDLKCYDYTKQSHRFRLLSRQHLYFLDTFRHHSPFPVYLSILKSNGPLCYRNYPDSSCGLIPKTPVRSFKMQLYRFVRFWAIIGLLVVIAGVIYTILTNRKQTHFSLTHHQENSDGSSKKKQPATVSNRNNISRSSVNERNTSSSINQNLSSSHNDAEPLNQQIEKHLRSWLGNEKNDGFRNLSEIYRIAINNTLLKRVEQLSVETLQFANAKIRNVSQTNQNNSAETPVEKLVINAVLDIDHLILNAVNAFKEQHFTLETQRLSGQLQVLLITNPNQYTIEANVQQLRIDPVNIIDPKNNLSINEKQSIVKLLDETINRTTVRYSFRLSDNQEDKNYTTLYNSSFKPYSESNKTYLSNNQVSPPSIQNVASRTHESASARYQILEPPPALLVNDSNQYLYTKESTLGGEPRKLLVRILKAIKLHDVEQPYCIIELDHPKQVKQTDVAKNGLNPFWDERFIFDCDEQSSQLRLQIIDRKRSKTKATNNYVDTVYANVSIPFSYAASTVYKKDIPINPKYPDSVVRLEISTLSEEDALTANNGYDVESIDDTQSWTYDERAIDNVEPDFQQRYPPSPTHDFLSASYNTNTLPKDYSVSSSLYDDNHGFLSTMPRTADIHPISSSFSQSSPLTPRDGTLGPDKPPKSKSFMSSLKHLTLPRRKHGHKDKRDNSMNSHASSFSQLNTNIQPPSTNPVSHSYSSAISGLQPEHMLTNASDPTSMRRSRSISQSFKNLFRSSSRKKANAAKKDAQVEYENGAHNFIVDNPNLLSASTPTSKKLSFLHRRKSKQKNKEQTNYSANSLSSYDCSRMESMRDTPVRANVGHPVTMTKSFVQ